MLGKANPIRLVRRVNMSVIEPYLRAEYSPSGVDIHIDITKLYNVNNRVTGASRYIIELIGSRFS